MLDIPEFMISMCLGKAHTASITHLEEDVVKARAEVCPINRIVARGLRVVDVFALRAVQLDVRAAWDVVLTHRQQMLAFADHSWALSKDALLVLLHLGRCVSDLDRGDCGGCQELTIFARPLVVTT